MTEFIGSNLQGGQSRTFPARVIATLLSHGAELPREGDCLPVGHKATKKKVNMARYFLIKAVQGLERWLSGCEN